MKLDPRLAALAAIAALALVAARSFAPPDPRGADAPVGEFSAARAAHHLAVIAAAPRSVGSEHHARTREYIVQATRALGAQVELQTAETVNAELGNPFSAAVVHNVVARLPGRGEGAAVLIVAHYDTVPGSPGAADDGAGVAAMLEAMQALAAAPAGRNDLVFLFSDAEEIGLVGARAFLARSWSDAYRVVLNFEARGSRGPSMMFETLPESGTLVAALRAVDGRVFANSLSASIYRLMSEDSDLTVFRQTGAAGLNFAFIHGLHDYHASSDRPDRIDAGSLQHHGDLMLGVLRELREADLDEVRGGESVYFDVFGRALIRYPAGLSLPLAGLTLAGLLLWIALAARRGACRPLRALAVAGIALGVTVLVAALVFGLWHVVVMLEPALAALPLEEPYDVGWYVAAFAMLSLAATATAGRIARGRFSPVELAAGVALLLSVFALATAIVIPGASYLFQWPLAALLPAVWWYTRGEERRAHVGAAIAAIAPAVAAILFVPLIDALFAALGVQLAAAPIALAQLALLTLLPLIAGWSGLGRAAQLAALAALVLLVIGFVANRGFDRDEPRPAGLVYVEEADERIAPQWLAMGPAPDDWSRRTLGEQPRRVRADQYFPRLREKVWSAPAPDLALPAPEAMVIGERPLPGGGRAVKLQLRSPRGAWLLQVKVEPDVRVLAATIAGRRLDAATLARQHRARVDGIVFRYYAARDGYELEFELPAGQPLKLRITDLDNGLPAATRDKVGPRPDDVVPAAYGWLLSDASVVSRTVSL